MTYFDYAATTPIDPHVLDAMIPYLNNDFGNASSVHTVGRTARMAVERARQQVADALVAQPREIVFTSSASEANNLALKGLIEQLRDTYHNEVFEVVATPIEHPCVIETLKHLEKLGWIRIIWLPINQDGLVTVQSIENAITERTVLISVMYVNNEIGTIMPIQEIGNIVKRIRKQRDSQKQFPLYFHCDAVQAIQYLECQVDVLGVDLLSLSAHKIYGPKGIGVLYIRNGVRIARQIDGGGQEYYMRAGTENVTGIVGAGEAFSAIRSTRDLEFGRLHDLQSQLIKGILDGTTLVDLTGSVTQRAPHISSFFFANTDAEALIIAMDRAGFEVSSGSACSSGVVRQSHVITALNLPQEKLKRGAAVRISTGRLTTAENVAQLITAIPAIVKQVREMSV